MNTSLEPTITKPLVTSIRKPRLPKVARLQLERAATIMDGIKSASPSKCPLQKAYLKACQAEAEASYKYGEAIIARIEAYKRLSA